MVFRFQYPLSSHKLSFMLEIDNTLVSLDLIRANFTCDFSACKGACCVTGDSGAPLEPGEAEILKEKYRSLRPYLSKRSFQTLEEAGTSVIDAEQDLVTPLNDGQECAYVVFERGIAKCSIEKAYNDGVINFRKPVSCFLYPVRIKKYTRFTAVNYDRWDICRPAITLGNQLKMPVYRFVKDALIAHFGKDWYDRLSEAAQNIEIEKLT